MPRRRSLRVLFRYTSVLLREFKVSLIILAAMVLVGGSLYAMAPPEAFAAPPPTFVGWPFLAAWMNLFAQPIAEPKVLYLGLIEGIFPLFGFGLVGEGIVRFGMLMFSRRLGEKEWMTVMASTFRDHVVICGLGHLGFRILGQLLTRGESMVAIERNPACPFLGAAKESGVPVLLKDMRDDQTLREAGIEQARVVVVASDDDLANIEVALDARRMNPRIRILLRLFDQRIADKFKEAGIIDEAFSSAALAAPVVADLVVKGLRKNT
jgi:voltage-gated potassium channel